MPVNVIAAFLGARSREALNGVTGPEVVDEFPVRVGGGEACGFGAAGGGAGCDWKEVVLVKDDEGASIFRGGGTPFSSMFVGR